MRYVCKNPPGGGGKRNPYQLTDYYHYRVFCNEAILQRSVKKIGAKKTFVDNDLGQQKIYMVWYVLVALYPYLWYI